MLVAGFPAGTFQANCYVLAPGRGGECVIVDPGQHAAVSAEAPAPLESMLAEHAVTPAAILATHGHPDHIHDAAAVAAAHDVPVWIHPEDRPLLSDPRRGLPDDPSAQVVSGQLLDGDWTEPHRVADLTAGTVEVAGLRIDVLHTPGHTPGSVVLRVETGEGGRIALTGDTLFAGSVGRTDLPGGDAEALRRSLAALGAALEPDTVLLPGHGPSTTMERERASVPSPGTTPPGTTNCERQLR